MYASLPEDHPEPIAGAVYKVPKHLAHSGYAELLRYNFTETKWIKGSKSYWSLYLHSIPLLPVIDDPCDEDFMEEIST